VTASCGYGIREISTLQVGRTAAACGPWPARRRDRLCPRSAAWPEACHAGPVEGWLRLRERRFGDYILDSANKESPHRSPLPRTPVAGYSVSASGQRSNSEPVRRRQVRLTAQSVACADTPDLTFAPASEHPLGGMDFRRTSIRDPSIGSALGQGLRQTSRGEGYRGGGVKEIITGDSAAGEWASEAAHGASGCRLHCGLP
jgi:hypothetical protein